MTYNILICMNILYIIDFIDILIQTFTFYH